MLEVKAKKKLGNFLLNSEICDESKVIAIFGRNGSGKSTFLKIIAGFLIPDEGYVRIDKEDVTLYPPWKRRVILVTPESYIPNVKVKKHLLWGAKDKRRLEEELKSERIRKLLSFSDETFKKKVKDLSLGMKMRVALVTALLANPKYILIDESFANINDKKEFMKEYLQLANERGINVVFVSQDLSDAEFAERSYRMENGVLKSID